MFRDKLKIGDLIRFQPVRNVVTDFGFDLIRRYVHSKSGIYLPSNFSRGLVDKDQYGSGKLPKRVAQYAHKYFNKKLDNEILSKIGSYAGEYSVRGEVFYFDFTDVIDWDSGDFGDDDSCFWGGRSNAKDFLLANGGLAVRFYEECEGEFCDPINHGYARAWIVPDCPYPDTLIVFNGYGMKTSEIASILSHYFKCDQNEIRLVNDDMDDGLLYINNSTGFILGEDVSKIYSADFGWDDPDFTRCCACGDTIEFYDAYEDSGDFYCSNCYDTRPICECCGDRTDETYTVFNSDGSEEWCWYCKAIIARKCSDCDTAYISDDMLTETSYGSSVCYDCLNDYEECEGCGGYVRSWDLENGLCETCAEREDNDQDKLEEAPRTLFSAD